MRNMKKTFVSALVLIAFGANVHAQTNTATATTTATIVSPIIISKVTDMNFGILASSGTTGTVDLNYADVATPSGGVNLIGGISPKSAEFTVSGTSGATFTIALANTTITLSNGTDNMTVDNITADLGTTGTLTDGTATIKVGGRLNVPANAPAGTYFNASDLSITVNYN